MALNSVNTNVGAMVALQSLNKTNDALAVTQKRISTGLRVSDAQDDGAAFAIAQGVRSDMAGLQAANDQMQGTQGLVTTTTKALEGVSNKMADIKKVLVNLSNNSLSAQSPARPTTTTSPSWSTTSIWPSATPPTTASR